jgi:hypothetical protein
MAELVRARREYDLLRGEFPVGVPRQDGSAKFLAYQSTREIYVHALREFNGFIVNGTIPGLVAPEQVMAASA